MTKALKFEIGDKVRVLRCAAHSTPIGHTAIIEVNDYPSKFDYCARILTGRAAGYRMYFLEEELTSLVVE